MPTAVADAPAFVHGETDDKPRPAPSASSVTANAAVTAAPPMTAPHDTADDRDSTPDDIPTACFVDDE
jgi:hypothetical protein